MDVKKCKILYSLYQPYEKLHGAYLTSQGLGCSCALIKICCLLATSIIFSKTNIGLYALVKWKNTHRDDYIVNNNNADFIIQIKLRWALFVTYTIIQSIMRSEMCSLHLTHPSGAVGSRHCGTRGAAGGSVPCSRVSPQSWTLPARARIWTHNLGLPQVSSPTLYPLGSHANWAWLPN